MKIISLCQEKGAVEIFHLTDEYAKWCIEHAIGDEDFKEPETFNEFMTDFFKQLGYENAELKPFIKMEDKEIFRIVSMYPEEHIEYFGQWQNDQDIIF